MYDNIGGKIKGLAKVIAVLGIIAAIVTGFALMTINEDVFFVIGLVITVLGSIVAWISCFVLYGFGELVDKACNIERNICNNEMMSENNSISEDDRINKMENLRAKGLITDEEYNQIIKNG